MEPIDLKWVQTNVALLSHVWVTRQEASDSRTEMLYCYGRVRGYCDVVENFDDLNEQGFGGFIGHLRRMQAQSFADANHEANPTKKAQLCGMSDSWGDVAERSESRLAEWMEQATPQA